MREKTGFITIKMKRPGKGTQDCIKRENGTKGKETEGLQRGNDDMNLDRDSIITTA